VTTCVPLEVWAPLHAPLAVQLAPFEFQVIVALRPTVMVLGLTAIVTEAGPKLEPE
jgi:hypothetical protein